MVAAIGTVLDALLRGRVAGLLRQHKASADRGALPVSNQIVQQIGLNSINLNNDRPWFLGRSRTYLAGLL